MKRTAILLAVLMAALAACKDAAPPAAPDVTPQPPAVLPPVSTASCDVRWNVLVVDSAGPNLDATASLHLLSAELQVEPSHDPFPFRLVGDRVLSGLHFDEAYRLRGTAEGCTEPGPWRLIPATAQNPCGDCQAPPPQPPAPEPEPDPRPEPEPEPQPCDVDSETGLCQP